MAQSDTPIREWRVDRRYFGRRLLGLSLATLALSACSGLKGRPPDPNRKPHWEYSKEDRRRLMR